MKRVKNPENIHLSRSLSSCTGIYRGDFTNLKSLNDKVRWKVYFPGAKHETLTLSDLYDQIKNLYGNTDLDIITVFFVSHFVTIVYTCIGGTWYVRYIDDEDEE